MGNTIPCRICQSSDLIPFFDLGQQPPANTLLERLDQKENFYPLSLSYCKQCSLIQLGETVDPKELFSKYVWVTGTAKTTREFSEVFCRELVNRAHPSRNDSVLDVGSNDGTFLLPFLRDGFSVLGVDPAENIVELANKDGVPTLCRFFGTEAAQEIAQEHGKFKMIFARNVLAHVANTRDFVAGLNMCLADDGVLAIEVHYALAILEGLQYDSIYHEHLCYFTLKTLERLLSDFGLFVFDVARGPISGGSLIVYVARRKGSETVAFRELQNKESIDRANDLECWRDFARKSFLHREALANILKEAAGRGECIVGYGSSARSSTLLNFAELDSRIIRAIADQNPLKQGLYTAGTHILIESPEKVMARNPNLTVILAWNFAAEIIDILKGKLHYNGRVLLPLPGDPRVLTI